MFHVSTYICILILISHWIIKIKSTKFYWVTLCLHKTKFQNLKISCAGKNFQLEILNFSRFPAGNSKCWKLPTVETTHWSGTKQNSNFTWQKSDFPQKRNTPNKKLLLLFCFKWWKNFFTFFFIEYLKVNFSKLKVQFIGTHTYYRKVSNFLGK